MAGGDFNVPKRVIAPWSLARLGEDRRLPLIRGFYEPLTSYKKAVAFSLFALTDPDHPDDWQQAHPGDALSLVHNREGRSGFIQQHREDLYAAMTTLRFWPVPFMKVSVERRGRAVTKKYHAREVALLQGVGLVYRDKRTGDLLHPQEDPSLRKIRRPLLPKGFDRHGKTEAKDRRLRRAVKDDDAADVLPTLYRLPKNPNWTLIGIEWRWGTDILEDLQMLPAKDAKGKVIKDLNGRVVRQGVGWIEMRRTIFAIHKRLRDAHQHTAVNLCDLLVSDLAGRGATRQVLEQEATRVFQLLGFSDPGSMKAGSRELQDGRWSENVARVADAVKALKTEGVLEPESDEEPRIDPNPDRRKAAYYRWKRTQPFTPTFGIFAADELADIVVPADATPTKAADADAGPAVADVKPTQPTLFGGRGTPSPKGTDIRAAREAAGMNLRAFAHRFGRSIKFWSDVENEVVEQRTGEPKPVPADIRAAVADFVREQMEGRKDGETL